MGIQALSSLLTAGEFIGKTSKSGLSCLKNVLEDGKTVFTMLDKDMNVVKQTIRTTIEDGMKNERYLANGEKYLESCTRKKSYPDAYNYILHTEKKFGGLKHKMLVEKRTAFTSYSFNDYNNPNIDTKIAIEYPYKNKTDMYNHYAYNMLTGDTYSCNLRLGAANMYSTREKIKDLFGCV